MNCAEFEPLVNAWIDGELPIENEEALRAHLEACIECAALVESLQTMDAQFDAAFAIRIAAVAQVPARMLFETAPNAQATSPAGSIGSAASFPAASTQIPTSTASSRPPVSRSSLVSWVSAIAAALLILAFSWESPEKGANNVAVQGDLGDSPQITSVARLIVASGDVRLTKPGDEQVVNCAPLTELPAGWKVITGENSRCELTTASPDQAVRLDQNTEVSQVNSNTLRLEKGRMWTSAKQDFCLVSPTGNIETKNATFEFSCAADNSTTLNVFEGAVDVTSSEGDPMQVRAGESVHFGNWGMRSTQAIDPVLGTSWLNDILVMKGAGDQELVNRIEWLWSQIQTKDPAQAAAYENEIRALGGCSVGPLCNWVRSPASMSMPAKRVEAAKLLSDLAGPDSIPRLIDLLNDNDGDVRFFAAIALQRLTGETLGRTPEEWKALPGNTHQKARHEWSNWLENKSKAGAP